MPLTEPRSQSPAKFAAAWIMKRSLRRCGAEPLPPCFPSGYWPGSHKWEARRHTSDLLVCWPLVLAVVVHGWPVPLLWKVLPNEASDTTERQDLVER